MNAGMVTMHTNIVQFAESAIIRLKYKAQQIVREFLIFISIQTGYLTDLACHEYNTFIFNNNYVHNLNVRSRGLAIC